MLPPILARFATGLLLAAVPGLAGCGVYARPEHAGARATVTSGTAQKTARCGGSCTALLFWSPSCEACKPWLALADRLWRQNATCARLVGVTVDGSPDEVRAVLDAYRIAFPQTTDLGGSLQARAGIGGLPALVVTDRCQAVTRRSREGDGAAELERLLYRASEAR